MSDTRVGAIVDRTVSTEQRAVVDWLRERIEFEVEQVSLPSLADVNLNQFDVLWWHREEPIPDDVADQAAPPLADYVTAGGGLFLSLYALTMVDTLGVDPVAPDRRWTTQREGASGFLLKTIYQEHPIFDGVEGLDGVRVPCRGEGGVTGVTYHDRIPRRGELLAASVVEHGEVHEGDAGSAFVDRQNDFGLVTWGHGKGSVIGVGDHLVFTKDGGRGFESNRNRLTANILSFLGSDTSVEEPIGVPASTSGFDRLRAAVGNDPHRPQYHFTPPANWLNDPNGLIQTDDGTYHLFYQHNPAGPVHGTIHWGHAVSEDLLHWEDRPIALAPDLEGPDSHGCYSGSATMGNEGPIAMYTGVTDTVQTTCLATASDSRIDRWEKHSDNPVVEAPLSEFPVRSTERTDHDYDFRDPAVWRGNDGWYHLVGTGTQDGEGTALVYHSTDLREWEYLGPIHLKGEVDVGEMWECPEWFPLDEYDLLHVSNYSHRAYDRAGVPYLLGDFDVRACRFDVEVTGMLDAGRFYAPQSLQDDEGRRVLFGWLPESRTARDRWDAGWAGAISLPRVLSLENDEVRMRPVPAVAELREGHRNFTTTLTDERQRFDVHGDCLEIEATFEVSDTEEVGLVLRCSPGYEEKTVIRYRPSSGETVLDRSDSTLSAEESDEALDMMAIETTATDTIELRVFLDRSIVETFVNERDAITGRIYPTRSDSNGVAAYADGEAHLDLDVWQLGAVFDA